MLRSEVHKGQSQILDSGGITVITETVSAVLTLMRVLVPPVGQLLKRSTHPVAIEPTIGLGGGKGGKGIASCCESHLDDSLV